MGKPIIAIGLFTVQSFVVISSAIFLLLRDVNEWIDNECSEFMIPHLNISNCFTRSHPSKGENRRKM